MLDVLSVTGGVPKYLEELNPSLSADENIRQLCFTREGMLFRDFNQIFSQIFGKKAVARKSLLHTLAYGAKSAAEIALEIAEKVKAVGFRSGASVRRVLDFVVPANLLFESQRYE